MVNADRRSGIFWLVFSVIICIESYKLGLGDLNNPGPGFMFFWAGAFLFVASLILMGQAHIRSRHEKGGAGENKPYLKKIALLVPALFIYALLLETVGFLVLLLVLLIYILAFIEKKGIAFSIMTSILVTVAAYLIFDVFLKSQLPAGILESLGI